MSGQLLWRKALKATLDTLVGASRGQYHIAIPRLPGIEGFVDGLPRTSPTAKGGYDVVIPLEAAPAPLAAPASSVTLSYIGTDSARGDWRIRSQRPDTAYPLWRPSVGPQPGTPSGSDFVMLLRDPQGAFHARWLRGAQLSALPEALAERLRRRTAGVEQLDDAAWNALARLLALPPTPVAAPASASAPAAPVGAAYRSEDEAAATAPREPFAVDPDAVDRGTRAHRRTQNRLAAHLDAAGIAPLSPAPGDPPFDVAWRERDGGLVVAEVKSLTARNEEKQLRLALGQVLRYSHQLRGRGDGDVRAALALERRPADEGWLALCADLGVRIGWPGAFDALTA